jgi:hypothetical protein
MPDIGARAVLAADIYSFAHNDLYRLAQRIVGAMAARMLEQEQALTLAVEALEGKRSGREKALRRAKKALARSPEEGGTPSG